MQLHLLQLESNTKWTLVVNCKNKISHAKLECLNVYYSNLNIHQKIQASTLTIAIACVSIKQNSFILIYLVQLK